MHTLWELHHKNKISLENCTLQSFSYSRTFDMKTRNNSCNHLTYYYTVFVRVYACRLQMLVSNCHGFLALSYSFFFPLNFTFISFQVAVGGSDGILCHCLCSNRARAGKPEEAEKSSQHILEDFHSSRTIRKLVLDCPAFASVLFKKALSGKCWLWAQGHWLA